MYVCLRMGDIVYSNSLIFITWFICRYGSVYGGLYGEFCCAEDNRINSYAAVRFRFMLRCLRKKRLKAYVS
jgi:hypothetical protein